MSIATAETGTGRYMAGRVVPGEEFYSSPRYMMTTLDASLRASYAREGIKGLSDFLIGTTGYIRSFAVKAGVEVSQGGRFYYNPLIRSLVLESEGVALGPLYKQWLEKADAVVQSNLLPLGTSIDEVERLRNEQLSPKDLYGQAVSGILSEVQQYTLKNPGQKIGVFFFDSELLRIHLGTLGFLSYQASRDKHLMPLLDAAGHLTAGAYDRKFMQALHTLYKGFLLIPNRNLDKRKEGIEHFLQASEIIGNSLYSGLDTSVHTFAHYRPITNIFTDRELKSRRRIVAA